MNQTLDDNETFIPDKKYFTNEDYSNNKWSGIIDWSPTSYKSQRKWLMTDIEFTPNFEYINSGKYKVI